MLLPILKNTTMDGAVVSGVERCCFRPFRRFTLKMNDRNKSFLKDFKCVPRVFKSSDGLMFIPPVSTFVILKIKKSHPDLLKADVQGVFGVVYSGSCFTSRAWSSILCYEVY